MPLTKNRLIRVSFAILFIIISLSSFSLSYLNLMAAATEAGIIPELSWLWPLCLDSFIIMGSLFVLQANLNDEPSWQGWAVLILFTLLSCAFNIAHSPSDILSRAAHAAPPVALCGSLEMLMIRIKRDLLRSAEGLDQPGDPIPPASPEKIERVRNWFTMNPEGSINRARFELRMGPKTVSDCRDYLVVTGQLTQ